MSMNTKTWAALFVAALFEVGGDYAIRVGRLHSGWRLGATALGMALLAAYGVAVTYWWEGEFGKLLGLYVAFFLVVSQVWGWLAEHDDVTAPKFVGAVLVVLGGCLIQFWPAKPN